LDSNLDSAHIYLSVWIIIFSSREWMFVLVLVLSFRQKILLGGLTSGRGEEHGRRPSQYHDERLNSSKGVDIALSK
jgi:hypothetical protein